MNIQPQLGLQNGYIAKIQTTKWIYGHRAMYCRELYLYVCKLVKCRDGLRTIKHLLNIKSDISILGIVYCSVGDTGGSPHTALDQSSKLLQRIHYSHWIRRPQQCEFNL